MFKSLVYKEWLKLRWIFVGLAIINCLAVINIYFDLANTFKSFSANVVVGQYQFYEVVYYSDIKYVVLLTGLILGIFQFFPEMNQSRLKLTFHLPVNESKLMFQMTSIIVILLISIFLVDTLILSIVSLKFLPREFFENMLTTTLPWYIGSICAYLWIVIIFIEPNWVKRIISVLIAAGFVNLFYSGVGYSKYNPSILFFVLVAIVCGTVYFLSAYNFKRGIC
jgi:hypothetical protein